MQDLLFIEHGDDDEKDATVGSAPEKVSRLPQLDMTTLFDNEAEDERGWNFLDDSRN